jgi:ferredoxin-fold anticodon binding domain-containing protein
MGKRRIDRMKEMNDMIGKKVFIKTNSGRYYNGVVKNIENDFIKLIDKYNALVYIALNEVNFIEEKHGE